MFNRAGIYRSFTIDIAVRARAQTEILLIVPICEVMFALISFFGVVADESTSKKTYSFPLKERETRGSIISALT